MSGFNPPIRYLIFLFTWLAVWISAANVLAEETVPAEVLVVLAFEKEGEIDTRLADIAALKRPPFSSFRSMKVLTHTTDIQLKRGQPFTISLPNGRHLKLALKQLLPDGRSMVQLSINRPDRKDYLPLLEVKAKAGEPFFVAGQKHEGGTLVVGVRVGNKPQAKQPGSKQRSAK